MANIQLKTGSKDLYPKSVKLMGTLTFDGTRFPANLANYGVTGQLCVPARNMQNGSLYILWFNNNTQAFEVGATISGSTPTQGQQVYVLIGGI